MNLSGSFIFPVSSLLQRPVEYDGPRARAIINAAAAIPAFIGMQYDRRFAFLRMGNIHIYLADLHTMVTPVADILIENNRIVRGGYIWNGGYFFLRHIFLQ
jgi:hypothetical protein